VAQADLCVERGSQFVCRRYNYSSSIMSKGASSGGRSGGARGMSFVSDFNKMGQGGGITRTAGGDFVLQEEKRLIDKVFDIIDRDQSGTIDTSELVEMFTNMGMEQATTTAVERIMQNVDRDHSEAISRDEFYKFLSSKLSKKDSNEEIQAVFKQFDRNSRDDKIDANDIKDVATQLGETLSNNEIKDMLKMFSKDGVSMTLTDFMELMRSEIPGEDTMVGGSEGGLPGKDASGSSLGTRIGGFRGSVDASFQGGVNY